MTVPYLPMGPDGGIGWAMGPSSTLEVEELTVFAAAAIPIPAGVSISLSSSVHGGTAPYSYQWSVESPVGAPAPVFSNAAISNPTVTFGKAGTYTFTLTVTDSVLDVAVDTVVVNVTQTLTTLTISPPASVLTIGGTLALTQTQLDQFGDAVLPLKPIVWSTTGSGSINQNGVYTAPPFDDSATITATNVSTGISETAFIAVTQPGVGEGFTEEAAAQLQFIYDAIRTGQVTIDNPINQETLTLKLVRNTDYKVGSVRGPLRFLINNAEILEGEAVQFGATSKGKVPISKVGTVVVDNGTKYAQFELTKETDTNRPGGTNWRYSLNHVRAGVVSSLLADQEMVLEANHFTP